ncbi:M56 family metallopeptidase [Lacrimispora sp.]|uniref:M56 family metallopeptidase n=1 Tax=Lacrimispora sp. TaxID=2719234 RepID=UPI0028A62C5E|nr:M56 family metallopeptidase [Lacrimispora sp.]
MFLSPAALITILLIINLSVILLWLFLKSHRRIMQISLSTLLLGILLVVMRLLLPMEFAFQQTIREKNIFPSLFLILYTPVLEFVAPGIYVYHVILLIWILGILVLSMKNLLCHMRFLYLIKREADLYDEKVKNTIKKIEDLHGKSSNFKIIMTNKVSVPMYFGLFRPIIILPMIELSDQELYYILRHESTHYYNNDLWIKLFVEFICIIYWWNPFVYILKHEVDKILEIRVDMDVTKMFDESEKVNYLECLIRIAKETASPEISSFSLPFDSRTVSVLSQRFHIVLAGAEYKKSKVKNMILLVSMIFVLIISSFVVFEPYSINPKDQEKTLELTPENAYLIVNADNGYDVYVNNEYFATVTTIRDSYSNLSIYNNFEEALLNEREK